MFLLGDDLYWSASDLTAAAQCEYTVLRALDVTLGWTPRIERASDPFLDHIARLGDRHEQRLLDGFVGARQVARLAPAAHPYSTTTLDEARDATYLALHDGHDLIYQAAFCDGEFFGYADFLEHTDDGWVVCDAKLARTAKPQALIQLGAYADQLHRLGVPVAPQVSLLMGDGRRADFATPTSCRCFGNGATGSATC